jgi:hypothetical protein
MTIGGWSLGNAWLAWITARRWQWNLVFSALIYLWLFGVGELVVVFLFRQKLNLAHPIAWLYLSTLLLNTLTAVTGFVDWLRIRPSARSTRQGFGRLLYGSLIFYILFVGFLGFYGLTAQVGAPGTNGGIFPEIMSPFTLKSFGMFYLTLALGVIPFLWNQNLSAILHHGFASFGLIIFITVAAFLYFHLFNFATKPGGAAYLIAYLGVGIAVILMLRKYGTGTSH